MSVSTGPVAAAFARGYVIWKDEWIDLEIIGVPYIADHGGHVVDVWAPTLEAPYGYQVAALSLLRPRTRHARELLRLRPTRKRTP